MVMTLNGGKRHHSKKHAKKHIKNIHKGTHNICKYSLTPIYASIVIPSRFITYSYCFATFLGLLLNIFPSIIHDPWYNIFYFFPLLKPVLA